MTTMPLGRSSWPGAVPDPPTLRSSFPVAASFTTSTSVVFAVDSSQCWPSGPCHTAGESMLSSVSRSVCQTSSRLTSAGVAAAFDGSACRQAVSRARSAPAAPMVLDAITIPPLGELNGSPITG
jgi:hypothetical protein